MMSAENIHPEPEIKTFGPHRMIGLRYVGKNEHEEIKAMWGNDFWPRAKEIKNSPEYVVAGTCRCLPEATDGSFEYMALLSAGPDAPVPPGMAETTIPEGTYAVFPVFGLDKIHEVWASASEWAKKQTDIEVFCDGTRGFCDCANHPSFELYTEEFSQTGKFYIYFPVKKK
jgi:predicted transcriptional regulator YdeE